MPRRSLRLLLLVPVLTWAAPRVAPAAVVSRSQVSGGGGVVSSGLYALSYSVGPCPTGIATSTQYKEIAGFWASGLPSASSVEATPKPQQPLQAAIYSLGESVFHNSTRIGFSLPGPDIHSVGIRVLDIQGRTRRLLSSSSLAAGQYELVWDGRDDNGAKLSAGIYWVRLTSDETAHALRLVLLH